DSNIPHGAGERGHGAGLPPGGANVYGAQRQSAPHAARCRCLSGAYHMMRCPPASPLCASWPWPRHIGCLLEALDMTVYEKNVREADRRSNTIGYLYWAIRCWMVWLWSCASAPFSTPKGSAARASSL